MHIPVRLRLPPCFMFFKSKNASILTLEMQFSRTHYYPREKPCINAYWHRY
jgi:hypothetical protein